MENMNLQEREDFYIRYKTNRFKCKHSFRQGSETFNFDLNSVPGSELIRMEYKGGSEPPKKKPQKDSGS